jgi:SAM-dependent methyltransferase
VKSTTAPSAARNVTGAEYVLALSAHESDRRARAAFRARALALSAPGDCIYDFGAGPGQDARYYAEQGRRVEAYDIDAQMCAYFADYCADFMAAGTIRLHDPSFAQFLHSPPRPSAEQVALVTANFAPLNLVDDLAGLFATFSVLTRPGGAVLASVLNPYYLGDLKYRWWWTHLPQLIAHGAFFVPGAQARIWRRRLADYARQSTPGFDLEQVFAGAPEATGIDARAPLAFTHLGTCRFMFLLFRRRAL